VYLSMDTPSNDSTRPLGHVIVTRGCSDDAPRPTMTRGSLADA
jgi:hypothetical protein